MGVSEWAAWQARRERREGEATATLPLQNLYPPPKKDRREPKERKK